MPKKLAIFLDGTWNNVDDNTNVWRLKSLCESNPEQFVYYSSGVGTQFSNFDLTHALGGMFGYGLDTEILTAYGWLIENYEPEDKIFIFGFSRGAYTARSLAGLISKCGLLKRGAPLGINQLFARYKNRRAATIRYLNNHPSADCSQEDNWLKKYSRAVTIKFIGVWDTVGALGIPFGNFPLISREKYRFLDTDIHTCNDYSYHALAIDEHREAFAPTLWTQTFNPNDPTSKKEDLDLEGPVRGVEQRWFVGAHADVGGGEMSDLLAQKPLLWLMKKAEKHSLIFAGDVELDDSVYTMPVTNSFATFLSFWSLPRGIYWLLKLGRPYYRLLGAKPTERDNGFVVQNINETMDSSVFERWRRDKNYRPKNLKEWAERYGTDLGSLTTSVRADNPTVYIPEV